MFNVVDFPGPERFIRPLHISMLPVQDSPYVKLPVNLDSFAAHLMIDERTLARTPSFAGALVLPMFAIDQSAYRGTHIIPEQEDNFKMHLKLSGDEYAFHLTPDDIEKIEVWRADDLGISVHYSDSKGSPIEAGSKNLFIAIVFP